MTRPGAGLLAGLLWLPALAGAAQSYTSAHLDEGARPHTVTVDGQRYVDHGLVGAGRLSAQTVDFLGDTLGSFSSLAIDHASWKRVGDHYEGVLWTLPDRGRNDPDAGLFYDYAARVHRYRLRFTPAADGQGTGTVTITPDGGLVLRDFRGQPFTGADPADGTQTRHGVLLPSPSHGVGAGKLSLDAESLQFARDGSFYVGDEYTASVFHFDADGRLQGIIVPPVAVLPRRQGKPDFRSLRPPESGRRNNQGVEGMSLSPDGTRLFVMLQSALVQDSAVNLADKDDASGRTATRVLVYDTHDTATPAKPVAHYVVQLPSYRDTGDGQPANRTAAQSEIRALDNHRFLMLARDGNGLGTGNRKPIVYKSVLLVDTAGTSNLAGSRYETGTTSVLQSPDRAVLKSDIRPARWVELVNLLQPAPLARAGLSLANDPATPATLSEKWEAMDLVSALDRAHPHDVLLFVGNDNDFIARHCVMQGQSCDSPFDNDNRLLVYRLTLP